MLAVEMQHMRNCHHAQVAAIDQVSYAHQPWFLEDVRERTKPPNIIAFVAVDSAGAVVGYVVYEVFKSSFRLVRLAVHPNFRDKGIGGRLVTKLLSKLSPGGRSRVNVTVIESDLASQQFLRHIGFRGVNVLRSLYGDRDGFVFQYRYQSPCKV